MNKKEMVECFGVMMSNGNWENAKMFKGSSEKLDATVELWTTCLADIDYWTAQKAVVKLCQECVFPPTIAEFRAKADEVISQYKSECSSLFNQVRNAEILYGSLEAFYAQLPQGRLKTIITVMGGINALMIKHDDFSCWNAEEFRETYWKLLKRQPAMGTDQQRKSIPEKRQI